MHTRTRRKNGLYIAAVIAIFGLISTSSALDQGDANISGTVNIPGSTKTTDTATSSPRFENG